MAGGHSETKPSNAPFYIVGVLWLLTILVVSFLYFSHRFVLFSSTLTPEATSTPVTGNGGFKVTSSAYEAGGVIPIMYTCDAKQISPPFSIEGAPEGTRSFALIMEDRDIPVNLKQDGTFVHWNVFNIPPETTEIGTGEIVGTQGASSNGVAGYMGPCPPGAYEPTEHRYYLDVFALDTTLDLFEGASVKDVRTAIEGHILAHTSLMGRYERQAQ